MKITLLIQRIANRAGGAERVVVNVANQLVRHGWKVEILAFESTDGLPFYPLDSAVDYRNLGIMDAGKPAFLKKRMSALSKWCQSRAGLPLLGHVAWYLSYGTSVRRLRLYLEDHPSDLLIAFLPSTFTLTAKVAACLGLPYILSCHNVPEEDFENPARWDQNPIDKRRRRQALQRCSAITVILPEFVDWFSEDVRNKVKVIRNFITRPSETYPPLAERMTRILAVGRYTDPKDHETLLRAWKRIEGDFQDWIVEIYGEGPLARQLNSLIEELGLKGRVLLKPPCSEIWKLYGNSRLFCIPSKFEGFGLVTAEAMACGTPAVGFLSCPGTNRIIIHGETGVLVDCEDAGKPAALAESLAELIRDPDLCARYSSRSLEVAEGYYVEQRVQDWLDLIEPFNPVSGSRNAHHKS